jgi:signal transduction histidine kinase
VKGRERAKVAGLDPEPIAETFDVHCERLSTRYLRFVASVELATGPGLWWLTRILHPGQSALAVAYRYFEAGFGIGGALSLALLAVRSSSLGARTLSMVNLVIVSAGLGVACALAPQPAEVPYHTVCCGFFMIAWSMRQRAIAMTAAVVAFVSGAIATAPERAADIQLINVYVYYSCIAFATFLMGHLLYRVVRENWNQRRALADRATALERLDRAKTELVANVSHELRTPLTLILGALEELRSHAPEIAARGLRNAGRLTALVDDMLQLARFDAGHGALVRRRGDLALLVREAVRSFEPLPSGGVLVTRIPYEPVTACVDPRQIHTVVFNLISNAIKFSDAASRRVEVCLEATDEIAVLTVHDNGAGIPSDALPHIFDRFYQADGTETRQHGGVGIGLALTNEIVALHGGRITVESAVGVGSSFRVELPRQEGLATEEADGESSGAFDAARRWGAAAVLHAATMEEGQPSSENGRGGAPRSKEGRALVLIAEDDADLRAYLVQVVSREHRVIVAHDGKEAEKLFDEHSPDLVLADLMMPRRTGADLLRHVRAAGRTPRVPVLILTALTEVEMRLHAFDAGADDYLAKPFDERELLARMNVLLTLAEQERRLTDRNVELAHRVAERTVQLRRLASHLEANREDERRRIARELHDELGQLLTGIRMEVAALRQARGGSEQPVSDRIDGLLDQAFAASRNLVYELRPRVLDDLGLVPAIEWYVERFRERSGLFVALDVDARRETSPVLATTLFRALQESLTNVARHARATRVNVRLRDEGERLVLSVEDDGCGFDAEQTTGGFGVLGLRERAIAAGGTLAIDSHDGRGTRVTFGVPRSPEADGRAA